ncbi:Purine nucleoside phosphorylase [Toxoplasma gondii GAB2-2007-GAL-DOM2]|uniref:Purine nucleoside phosphorylase n=3 Tax=Toxoplasma gondii TaxID=5811 RepID=A0A086JK69_TOXGO|nr:Purine nucleoside phosphorylase [Toxoplasma gondii GAB2-2007-GAL-DOM2]KFG32537.1 Purine nucleoside phosphorylase [Toxoplasma gondii FOU]PUA83491.1 Purine nucleoside phosphorylase [Toxoplasma gondii TgCATBr9]
MTVLCSPRCSVRLLHLCRQKLRPVQQTFPTALGSGRNKNSEVESLSGSRGVSQLFNCSWLVEFPFDPLLHSVTLWAPSLSLSTMQGMEVQPHIRLRKEDVEPVVIIVGDPARTEEVANMCEKKQELAYNREYRSFRVVYDSQPITVISHGIGCPGTSIAIEELAYLGAKVIIRAGTCGSLKPKTLKQGDVCVTYAAVNETGLISNILPEGFPCVATPHVYQALMDAAKELGIEAASGIGVTQDYFYQNGILPSKLEMYSKCCDVIDMEMSGVLGLCQARGIATCGILAVDGSPLQWDEGDYDATGVKATTGKENMIKITLKACANLRRQY